MNRELIKSLVVRAQNKEEEAFNELFSACYSDIYYFAYKTVNDREIAEDVTQEAFLEMYRTLDKLREPEAFPIWARRITLNRCRMYFRKKKEVLVEENEEGETIFDTLADESEDSAPLELLEKEEVRTLVREIVDGLTEEQRSAVMMFYFDELSLEQIAEVQGVPLGTVKSRLNYARKAMKAKVEEYEEKTNTKLHAIPFFPLFRLFFSEAEKKIAVPLVPPMDPALKEAAAEACGTSPASGAAGAGASAAETASDTARAASECAGTAAAECAAAVKATGLAAIPLWGKIAAGAAAILLAGGAALGAAGMIGKPAPGDPSESSAPESTVVESESAESEEVGTDCVTHTYGDWTVRREASCTEDGEQVRVCEICGAEEVETIDKTGHSFGEWTVVREASCTEDGERSRSCSCGTEETETIEKTGHTFGEWTSDEEGHIRVCTCGEKETEAHTYGEWSETKAASCTEDGERSRLCTVCGAEYTEAVPSTGHTVVTDAAAAATTSAAGKTEGSHCSVCGIVIREQEVIPKLPSQTEIGKLKTDMDSFSLFYNMPVESPADFYPANVLTLYVYEQGYHGSWYMREHLKEDGFASKEEVVAAMTAQGWVIKPGYETVDLPVYTRSIPRAEIDEWTLQHFGTTYDFRNADLTRTGVNIDYVDRVNDPSARLLVTNDRTFDISDVYYDVSSDCIVFVDEQWGNGGGFDAPWEDYCVYSGTSSTVDEYTVTFDYLLYTTTAPANTAGIETETIFTYVDNMIYSGQVVYSKYRGSDTDVEQTVWHVPYKLTFRYNGQTFEFVSLIAA